MTKGYVVVYHVAYTQASYISNLVKNLRRVTKKPVFVVPHNSNVWAKPLYIITVDSNK